MQTVHSSTYVAGVKFRPQEARDAYYDLAEGDTLTLEADPENEYDPGAIKVLAGGHHVGFIPRDHDAIRTAFIEGRVTGVTKREGNKISVHYTEDEEEDAA